jgi:UDP-N-acetylglucosamine transferase subunit ALG13
VTLGTIRPYRFDSLIDAVLATNMPDERSIWQLGSTTRNDLPGTVRETMTETELRDYASRADVVITHAGAGTLLNLLELGVHPVVVPRRRQRAEHVDDHQSELASIASKRGIAVVVEAPDIRVEHITSASALRNVTSPEQ